MTTVKVKRTSQTGRASRCTRLRQKAPALSPGFIKEVTDCTRMDGAL